MRRQKSKEKKKKRKKLSERERTKIAVKHFICERDPYMQSQNVHVLEHHHRLRRMYNGSGGADADEATPYHHDSSASSFHSIHKWACKCINIKAIDWILENNRKLKHKHTRTHESCWTFVPFLHSSAQRAWCSISNGETTNEVKWTINSIRLEL